MPKGGRGASNSTTARGSTARTTGVSAPLKPRATTQPRDGAQRAANSQKAPNGKTMQFHQKMEPSGQTRGTSLKGGQPRATFNTMAGKSGKRGE